MTLVMPLGESFASTLAAAQAGAEWGFSVLYRDLNPPLVRYFASRAPGEADDLAAETWMAAAKRLPSFKGEEQAFRAWMFTIAHRRLVQHWRDTSRRPPVDPSVEGLSDEAGVDDVEASVVESLSAQEAARRIAAALTPDQAEVVLLRILGGLDVDEVARIVGKRPGAVRVLQHKALRKLSERISSDPVTN